MASGDRAKRFVAAIYSRSAERLYEPLVVRTGFPLFGGDINDLVLEQGRNAVAVAGDRPILDMPVGTAYFTKEMATRTSAPVIGVDIAEGMVQKAARTGISAGLTNLFALQADAHRLPFPDGTFGAILCTNGLQVIPGLTETVTELARVLADDGTLFVSVVTFPLGRLLPRAAAGHLPTLLRSRRDVEDELRKAGLRVAGSRMNRLAFLIEASH
jgi:SAM-dependent methyltransferase